MMESREEITRDTLKHSDKAENGNWKQDLVFANHLQIQVIGLLLDIRDLLNKDK